MRAERERAKHAKRRGHANARAKVGIDHCQRRATAHDATGKRGNAERGNDGLVGKLFAPGLRTGFVGDCLVQDAADLARRGIPAGALDFHDDPSRQEKGRCEHLVAHGFLGRGGFTREHVLVENRVAIADDPVDRHRLAGMHDNEIARADFFKRSLHGILIAQEPDHRRLLAKGVQKDFGGIVAGGVEQFATESEEPCSHRPGKNLACKEAGGEDDAVEHIDPQATLAEQHPEGAFEARY